MKHVETLKDQLVVCPRELQFDEILLYKLESFEKERNFVVVDEDEWAVKQFVDLWVGAYPNSRSKGFAEEIVKKIRTVSGGATKIALFDCDRTIAEEDATIAFFAANHVSMDSTHEIFKGNHFTHYQFWKQKEIYQHFTQAADTSNFHFNPIVLNKINELRKEGYFIVGITAGIWSAWNQLNERHHFFDYLVGNQDISAFMRISEFVKGWVARILREEGRRVVSVGDGVCDLLMLENSSEGFIYAPGRIRPEVQQYFDCLRFHCNRTTIQQFSENPFQYKNITN